MRLSRLIALSIAASTLAACGIAPPRAAAPVCRDWALRLADAKGATPRDQAKLDGVVEGMIAAGCIKRAEAI